MIFAIARCETEPISVCLVSPTGESIERFEARKARSLAGLGPAKERLIGKVKPFERDLRRLRIEPSIRLVAERNSVRSAHRLANPTLVRVRCHAEIRCSSAALYNR